jgi:hypothetical protein
MVKSKDFLLVLSVIFIMFSATSAVLAANGATVVNGTSQRALADDVADTTVAYAGNITGLVLNGNSITSAWQGYFGNVTGVIQLADASDNIMYNWSLASPEGEVYASTSGAVAWTGIACFDLATNGAALETDYGIGADDVDGVDETFSLNNHAEFFTNNIQFTAGQCSNTKVYGAGGAAIFDEVLMTDGTNTIFTSILDDNTAGFDAATHDFEMLVLEDGHGTNTATTTYSFYVELE